MTGVLIDARSRFDARRAEHVRLHALPVYDEKALDAFVDFVDPPSWGTVRERVAWLTDTTKDGAA